MKNQTQNSIEQRIRDVYNKLRLLAEFLNGQSNFEEYSLCMDRLNITLDMVIAENHRNIQQKNQYTKEIKAKNNLIKEIRKDYELIKKQKQESHYEYQHIILNHKNTISELKKKIETAKESSQYHQYQKLKEENYRLTKQIKKVVAQVSALQDQKLKMISLVDYNSLKKQLIEAQKSLNDISSWEYKYQALSVENRIFMQKLQVQTIKIIQLQEKVRKETSLDGQQAALENKYQRSCQINSSQTCEEVGDYKCQDQKSQKVLKKKKSRKRGSKYPHLNRKSYDVQVEDNKIDEEKAESSNGCQISRLAIQSFQQQGKNIRSFSIVMFILAGVLAIPMPYWSY